jgi:dTDP-4-amino-4,6-dideoxygalactose transaminase
LIVEELQEFLPVMSMHHMHEDLADELDTAWKEARATNAFILGPLLERFEQDWAKYCGAAFCKGVGSGTEAIELALLALGIGPGDEVIVPASTFIATAAAVTATGASVVFTDVDETSLLLTAEHVSNAVTERTAAVIPVHLFGNVVDIEPLLAVADRHGLAVIEDASQAHGATYRGKKVGNLANIAAFSHYPTKNLGAFGDAGTVVTDREDLALQVRRIGNHGRATQSETEYTLIGRTSRLDGLQAAILSVKLAHLDRWVESRRTIASMYDEQLPEGIVRVTGVPVDESAPHLCCIRVRDRDRVREELKSAGIGTGVHYPDSVPRTPAYGSRRGEFAVAEQSADTLISLPLWPGMLPNHVDRVCFALSTIVR